MKEIYRRGKKNGTVVEEYEGGKVSIGGWTRKYGAEGGDRDGRKHLWEMEKKEKKQEHKEQKEGKTNEEEDKEEIAYTPFFNHQSTPNRKRDSPVNGKTSFKYLNLLDPPPPHPIAPPGVTSGYLDLMLMTFPSRLPCWHERSRGAFSMNIFAVFYSWGN